MAPKSRRARWGRKVPRNPRRVDVPGPNSDEGIDGNFEGTGSGAAEELPAETVDYPATGLQPTVNSEFRIKLFALLAWNVDYARLYEIDRQVATTRAGVDSSEFTSGYARRLLTRGGEAAQRYQEKHAARVGDAALSLARAANVFYVPFVQVVKAIAFVFMCVNKKVWVAERKKRRVVDRKVAIKVLKAMCACKPKPPFEINADIVSFGVDQTYLRSSGQRLVGAGISKYRAIQTIDATGAPKTSKSEIYMNGMYFPASTSFPQLSDDAREKIKLWGPYTQDFNNIIPILRPSTCREFQMELLSLAVSLLLPVFNASGDSKDAITALYRRPNHDPGGPTPRDFLCPLQGCNTQSYIDMIRIVEWVTSWIWPRVCTFIVLHLIGDGQFCLCACVI